MNTDWMPSNNYANWEFAQQGWQCPICRRVYSPMTVMCLYCGDRKPSTSTTVSRQLSDEEIADTYELIDGKLVPKRSKEWET